MTHESDKLLKSYVDQNQVPNALLFIGKDAHELYMSAKNFASDVIERRGGGSDQVDKVAKDTHPDVRFYAPSSQMGVYTIEQIRRISAESQLYPNEAPCQFFILKHFERIQDASANALLKTLEEPSAKTHFILLAHSKDALLPTIVSRVQPVSFDAEPEGVAKEEIAQLNQFLSKWPKLSYNDLYLLCEKIQGEKEKDLDSKIQTEQKAGELLLAVERWYQTLNDPKPSIKQFSSAISRAKMGLERSIKIAHSLEYLLLPFVNYD